MERYYFRRTYNIRHVTYFALPKPDFLYFCRMDMAWIGYGYFGLFAGSFIAATLIPLPSEALLIGALELDMPVLPVVIVATIGNTLGGFTNYWIGYGINNKRLLLRFKLTPEKVEGWERRTHRWGPWLGLFAWLPFVGDPMLVALGFLKVPFWMLSFMVLIGKALRYAVLAWLFFQI